MNSSDYKSNNLSISSEFEALDIKLPSSCWTKYCLIELLFKPIETDFNLSPSTLKQVAKRKQRISIFS